MVIPGGEGPPQKFTKYCGPADLDSNKERHYPIK